MSPLPLPLLLGLACAGSGSPSDTAASADTGGATQSPEALVAELGAPGPYGVGYTEETLETTDPAGAPRSLRLVTWYPSDEHDGTTVQYLGFVDAPGVFRDAAVADGGPFPVVVFSHGHLGYAEASGFLMAHLASHGFVVVAPDHTGDTTLDGGTRSTEIYFQRPADISAVLDHLADSAAGLADLDRVVGMGHSFGGYTMHALAGATYDIETIAPGCYDGSDTSEFCSTMSPAYEALFQQGFADPRLRAILAMGAGDLRLFGDTGIATIDRPGLWMAGELDGADAEAEEIFSVLQGGPDGLELNRRVQVLGAAHNFCIDLTAALDLDATIDDEEGWRIARSFALAWARRHGLDEDTVDVVLDGDVSVSDAVVLSR